MEPVDSIRRLGLARWYERGLIEGHAWFVSGFFCIIAIAACMEELSFRGSAARLLLYVIVVAAAAAIGVYGLVRYQKNLGGAARRARHLRRLRRLRPLQADLALAGSLPQMRQRMAPHRHRLSEKNEM